MYIDNEQPITFGIRTTGKSVYIQALEYKANKFINLFKLNGFDRENGFYIAVTAGANGSACSLVYNKMELSFDKKIVNKIFRDQKADANKMEFKDFTTNLLTKHEGGQNSLITNERIKSDILYSQLFKTFYKDQVDFFVDLERSI